jgi:acyl-CoA thioesterase I
MGMGIGLVAAVLLLVGGVVHEQVINRGYPGENTAELGARFDTVLMLHPGIVVLMGGANDALNPAKLLPPEATRQHVDAIVRSAREAGVELVLVTVHEPDFDRLLARHALKDYHGIPPQQRIAALNDVLREIARKQGIRLVDFEAVLREKGGATPQLSTDGVHLTPSGYGLLAAAVRTQLAEHVSETDTVVCFGDSLTYGIGVRPPDDAPETKDTYPAQLRALLAR